MTTARRRGSSPTATAVDAGTPSRRWWSPLPLMVTVFASLGVLLGGPGVAIGPVDGTTAARVLLVAVIVACLVHEVARALTARRPARRPEPPTPGADEDRASDLIAVVSHELRTPLTSMIGLMSTVQRGAGRLPPDRLAELAEMACEQGWRLERLVDDVLHGPARGSGDLRPDRRDAVVTVHEAVAALPTGDHDIVLSLPDTPVRRCLDHDVLVRIINNLVGNALKYTPAGSRITVAMRPLPTGLELAVADDGPGMSSEAQAKAFDKYWRGTAGGKGLGLGLYLVRLLAAAHGGIVTLEESPAGGCRFLVRLEELAASAPAPALAR